MEILKRRREVARVPDIESQVELERLLSHPEELFDGDLLTAEKQWERFQRLTERRHRFEKEKNGCRVEVQGGEDKLGSPRTITIIWPEEDSAARMVVFEPIFEGRGIESQLYGYGGWYGIGKKQGRTFRLIDAKKKSLQEIFGVSSDQKILFKLTADRWAVARRSTKFGDNTVTMYIGLGLLFLGPEWMHIGDHEAGHLPEELDENKAWSKANRHYAAAHRGSRDKIIMRYRSGKTTGRFGLLTRRKEKQNITRPTSGDIMKYGLVSHHVTNENVRIPLRWKRDQIDILDKLKSIIRAANDRYHEMLP